MREKSRVNTKNGKFPAFYVAPTESVGYGGFYSGGLYIYGMQIRKSIRRYWLAVVSGIGSALSYFRVETFDNWISTMEFLVSIDQWIVNNAARPGLFIVFFSIFLATAIWPALTGWINSHWAIHRLWKLRSDGISLRNQCPHSKTDYEMWIPRFRHWHGEVLLNAKKISPHLENWLGRLDQTRPPPANAAPFLEVRNMSEVLARMGDYLEQKVYKE